MPFYMTQWTYKDPQIKTMITKRGSESRAKFVEVAIKAFGGKLHNFFFCFGDYDGLCISEFPDNETAIACQMAIVGQGALASVKSTILLKPGEMENALRLAQNTLSPYRPPGS